MADAFAGIALGFSRALGGPYHDGVVRWPGKAEKDDSGRIIGPGYPIDKPCSVQVDAVTDAMRGQDGYVAQDMRLLILAPTIDADMNTDARVEVLAGPHVGTWSVESVARDPVGAYWECRGRRA